MNIPSKCLKCDRANFTKAYLWSVVPEHWKTLRVLMAT